MPHYRNAPITEALVDFRIVYDREVSLLDLKKFGSEIKSQYPHESPRTIFAGEINFESSQTQTKASQTVVGYIFHSPDRSQAVQARLDGFTVSRFPKYQDWPHLIGEAHRLWDIFVRTLRPKRVIRIAVRYINQINLPLRDGKVGFEDYLRTFPQVKGIEEDLDLDQFLLRLVIPQNDIQAKLILTEAVVPSTGDTIGIILDIDLFRENISLDPRDSNIWSILEKFRDRKNLYFEASITDTTRGLFV